MTATVAQRQRSGRRIVFQWWWLIWVGAAVSVFLCGAVVGIVSAGEAGPGHWFGALRSPAFGGRDRVTILAMGVDHTGNHGLADTIIVAAVYPKTGEISALSIPRDSRVLIPGVGTRRVNEAHVYGGAALMNDTIELLLGIPIDYHIEVDLDGLVSLVDAIGGVELEVEKRMYYRDRSQDLLIDLQPGLQRLNGKQAMGYVRFRHDAQGDLGRIERQRKFLRAVATELLSPKNVTRMPKLAQAFVQTVDTDLSVRDILYLKKMVEQAGPQGIRMATLPGRPARVHGASMLVLDQEEVQRTVDRVLLGEGIAVSVLNGSNVNGLAQTVASMLAANGCDIVHVGNAERLSDVTRIIDHRGQRQRVDQVAAWLGRGVVSLQLDGENPADVTVIVGQDMAGGAA